MTNSVVYIGKNEMLTTSLLEELSNEKSANAFLIKPWNVAVVSKNFNQQITKLPFLQKFKKWLNNSLLSWEGSLTKKTNQTHNRPENQSILDRFRAEMINMKSDPHFKSTFKTQVNFQNVMHQQLIEEFDYKLTRFNDLDRLFKNCSEDGFIYMSIKLILNVLNCFIKKPLYKNEQQPTLLIDRPESFLHFALIREIGYMLRKINEKISVIVTTHSSHFLYYFCSNTKTVKTEIKFLSTKQEATALNTQNNIKWTATDFKTLKLEHFHKINIFDRKIIFKTLMSSRIIFVEGINDKKLIDFILFKINELFPREKFYQNVYIWVCWGKAKMPNLLTNIFELLKLRFSKNEFFTLFDFDQNYTETELRSIILNKLMSKKRGLLPEWEQNYNCNFNLAEIRDVITPQLNNNASSINNQIKQILPVQNSFSFIRNIEEQVIKILLLNESPRTLKWNFWPHLLFEGRDSELKKLLQESKIKAFLQMKTDKTFDSNT